MVLNSFKEAVLDTGVALVINVPINFVLLWYADRNDYSISETTVFLTVTFTIIAIVRKTTIGTWFKVKNGEQND